MNDKIDKQENESAKVKRLNRILLCILVVLLTLILIINAFISSHKISAQISVENNISYEEDNRSVSDKLEGLETTKK